MTGNLSTDIIVIYLPAALAVIMGILGLIRGARRESVVSLSIVLAALIVLVWGTPWATDLHDMFTNFSTPDIRNILAYVVMALVVLVVGYLLGSSLVAHSPTGGLSRVGGFFLGLANGLAIGGYLIRTQFESASVDPNNLNTDLATVLTTNDIARYIWIWSNWFPLAVAIIAAIVALVGPFRRAQTIVATPAAQSNWGPNAAPAIGATTNASMPSPGPAAYTTGYGQGFTNQYPQQPAPQYGQQYPQQYGQQPYSQYGQSQPSQPTPPSFGGAASGYTPPPQPVVPSTQARVQDAPPTMPMPASDLPRSTPPGGQETHYFGTPASSPSSSSSPSSDWSRPGSEPSWMTSPSPIPSSQSQAPTTLPPVDSSLISRSEAPTQAQPVIDTSSTPSGNGSMSTTEASDESGLTKCPRCGNMVPSDATFCTECGYRLQSA